MEDKEVEEEAVAEEEKATFLQVRKE